MINKFHYTLWKIKQRLFSEMLRLQVQASRRGNSRIKPKVVLAIWRNKMKSSPLTDNMQGDTRDCCYTKYGPLFNRLQDLPRGRIQQPCTSSIRGCQKLDLIRDWFKDTHQSITFDHTELNVKLSLAIASL